MGWSLLPVSIGQEASAAQINELRAAIIERRRAVGFAADGGLDDPPVVASGELCAAETINAYRARLEEVIPKYLDIDESGNAWTKSAILAAAFGPGKTQWTTVPSRAGTPEDSPGLEAGDVMYVEHLNEMKDVIDLLYLVPLKEESGRQYATTTGSAWTWSETDSDIVNTAASIGNYQTGDYREDAESAPFDFVHEPVDEVTIIHVKAKGVLMGTDEDKTVKFINFVYGDPDDSQPSDRAWHAELRVSNARPAGSPRGLDTDVIYSNNLADDGTHTDDGKNDSHSLLEVYIDDYWGPRQLSGLPDYTEWPFWLTFVIEDSTGVIDAYAAEAAASGRELQIWWAKVHFTVSHIWAKLAFEYFSQ